MEVSSINIREFAFNTFHNVLDCYSFYKQETRDEFDSKSLSDIPEDSEMKKCLNTVEFPICISQLLLRDSLCTLYAFAFDEKNYKRDVKFMLFNCLKQRNNIFLKTVDVLSGILEAFLFCDRYYNFNLSFYDAVQWFVEWFQDDLAAEFFNKGGWVIFKKTFVNLHDIRLQILLEKNIITGSVKLFIYDETKYIAEIINIFMSSKFKYPIPDYVVRRDFKDLVETQRLRTVVYLRPYKEVGEYNLSLMFSKSVTPEKTLDCQQGFKRKYVTDEKSEESNKKILPVMQASEKTSSTSVTPTKSYGYPHASTSKSPCDQNLKGIFKTPSLTKETSKNHPLKVRFKFEEKKPLMDVLTNRLEELASGMQEGLESRMQDSVLQQMEIEAKQSTPSREIPSKELGLGHELQESTTIQSQNIGLIIGHGTKLDSSYPKSDEILNLSVFPHGSIPMPEEVPKHQTENISKINETVMPNITVVDLTSEDKSRTLENVGDDCEEYYICEEYTCSYLDLVHKRFKTEKNRIFIGHRYQEGLNPYDNGNADDKVALRLIMYDLSYYFGTEDTIDTS